MQNEANFSKSQVFITVAMTMNYNGKSTMDTWSKRTQTKPILSAVTLAKADLNGWQSRVNQLGGGVRLSLADPPKGEVLLRADLLNKSLQASSQSRILLPIEAQIQNGHIGTISAYTHCLGADDRRGHTAKRHRINHPAEALVMILHRFAYAEDCFAFKRMMQIGFGQLDYMLYRPFGHARCSILDTRCSKHLL
jgi:hypothetical protein